MFSPLNAFLQDKVAINSLSMVAEDHADSKGRARAIYSVIKHRLLSTGSSSNLLPLVYVIDSILKNVKGAYVDIIGSDAPTWLACVHRKLPDAQQRQKLQKVYKTWVDLHLFSPERLQAMGRCFDQPSSTERTTGATATLTTTVASSSSPIGALAGGLKQVVAGITRAVRFLLLIFRDFSDLIRTALLSWVLRCCAPDFPPSV
jgi:pre-mRNA cleavage complex 2 protein Pcf11